jgi:hypothetical protein
MIEHFDRSFLKFFSILSDLNCYRSAFSSYANHLGNAKPKKRDVKKIMFSICLQRKEVLDMGKK